MQDMDGWDVQKDGWIDGWNTHNCVVAVMFMFSLQFDSAWSQSEPLNVKFNSKGGGMKQDFARPSVKKRKV